jgi:hypothetical protein
MKLKAFTIISFLFITANLTAQIPGEWTWMGGTDTVNSPGIYGTQGISSPSINPPGTADGIEWIDVQGNFWMYGGESIHGWSNDLWKFDLTTKQWTWIKGSGGLPDQIPVYGINGVADISNSPGERATSASWSDNQSNLWLFGGIGYQGPGLGGCYHDLWKYNISSNMWTWMKGDSTFGYERTNAHYGIKGIEDTNNIPSYTINMDITWTDNSGDLWMVDEMGCLWRYSVQSNNWCWMNGDTIGYVNFGQQFIPSPTTTPGATSYDFTHWKDSDGNIWYLYSGGSDYTNELFKYYPSTNMWTWIWGDTTWETVNVHYGDTICNFDPVDEKEEITPWPRRETNACWIDVCDNLWVFGGTGGGGGIINDLVYYNTNRNIWVRAGFDTTVNSIGHYGTMGVSNPNNCPPNRADGLSFKDTDGNLWLFGGVGAPFPYYNYYEDMWRFGMDNGCSPCGDEFAGIEVQSKKDEIAIYPNPSYGEFNIESPSNIDLIIVTDILGTVVYEEKPFKQNFSIKIKKSGIYSASMFSGNNRIIKRIVVL